jgi:16S rRNA (uracil1498-N3)-methyltransferase
MHRFFLSPQNISSEGIHFPEQISRQIAQVLRLKPDANVIVLDGLGKEYLVRLTEVSSREVSGKVEEILPARGEPSAEVILMLCLTQREKFEWMLQKCTEVGASRFVPVISSRSLVQSSGEANAKYERWNRIICEAAEQSHRTIIPELSPTLKLEQALREATFADACKLIPWEDEKSTSLKTALDEDLSKKIAILIGPEGGFSSDEVNLAKAAGFMPVTLGPRILRMETAAIVSCALVLYERGELNSA